MGCKPTKSNNNNEKKSREKPIAVRTREIPVKIKSEGSGHEEGHCIIITGRCEDHSHRYNPCSPWKFNLFHLSDRYKG